MDNINAIIIDDSPVDQHHLASMISKELPNVSLLGSASNLTDGLSLIEQTNPNLVFLDIQIGNETGFELLDKVKKRSFQVIFTTSYDQYAITAIRFSAIDYLLKPIQKDELSQAISRYRSDDQRDTRIDLLISQLKLPKRNKITLSLVDGFEIVRLNDIAYFKAERNYSYVHYLNKASILTTKTLKYFDDLLENDHFYRSHQSYLVNIEHLKKYVRKGEGYLELQNGEKIPVSRSRKDGLLDLLSN